MQNKLFNFLNALKEEANKTRTENFAMTYRSTGSDVLDLFSSIVRCVLRVMRILSAASLRPGLKTGILQ